MEERKYKEFEEDEEFAKVLNTRTFKSKENEEIDGSHTDRDIVKGHTTTFEFEENEEFDKVFNNTNFEFEENEEDEEFNKVFNFFFLFLLKQLYTCTFINCTKLEMCDPHTHPGTRNPIIEVPQPLPNRTTLLGQNKLRLLYYKICFKSSNLVSFNT